MILWSNNYVIDDNTINPIVSKLKTLNSKKSQHYTSYGLNLEDRPEKCLSVIYDEILKSVTSDLGLYHRSTYFNPIWMQVYEPGFNSGHGYHDHFDSDTVLSWVHFIRPTNKKCFCFVDSNYNKSFPEKQNKGDFIVFPSWAAHQVENNSSTEDRVIIAGNIIFNTLDTVEPNSTTVLKSNRRHHIPKTYKDTTFSLWETIDYD